MSGTKEIKNRIAGIRDTQKITGAMYLIASTKQRTAKEEYDRTRPYFEALRGEIKRIFRVAGDAESIFLYPPHGEDISDGDYGYLVITADKGLTGAYNLNVIKETARLMEQHTGGANKLYVIGEYGRQYYQTHHIPIEEDFRYSAQNPTIHRARKICRELLDAYTAGKFRKLFVIYSDLGGNAAAGKAVSTRLLPFHRAEFTADEAETPVEARFEFLPSVEKVLEGIIPSYVVGYVYAALADSFCCEQSARMSAMNAANDNARELIGELNVQLNHVRQTAITQEIIEVATGGRARRR